jgi:hypothetical protein
MEELVSFSSQLKDLEEKSNGNPGLRTSSTKRTSPQPELTPESHTSLIS